jgi:hypothetical protein
MARSHAGLPSSSLPFAYIIPKTFPLLTLFVFFNKVSKFTTVVIRLIYFNGL